MAKDKDKARGTPNGAKMTRTLIIDLETSPKEVLHFGKLWNTYIRPENIVKPTQVICFAAKWHGEKKVFFHSIYHSGKQGMLKALWELMNEADILVTYNGKKFDVPQANREFLEAGFTPPSPCRQVDIYETMKRVFAFESNSLDFISTRLKIGQKIKHAGMELWVRCMAMEAKAWALMKRYNKQDVLLTDELYTMVLPWIPNHPSIAHDHEPGEINCPRCASADLRREGYALTQQGKFQRYSCRNCGGWSRGTRRVNVGGAGIAPVAP